MKSYSFRHTFWLFWLFLEPCAPGKEQSLVGYSGTSTVPAFGSLRQDGFELKHGLHGETVFHKNKTKQKK